MGLLQATVDLWLKQIERAKKRRYEEWGKTANRARDFLGKQYQDLYPFEEDPDSPESQPYPQVPRAGYKCRLNLTRQFVSTYIPHLHHTVPHRLATPSRPQPPPELLALLQAAPAMQVHAQDQIRAYLLQWWLNYLPGQYGLQNEVRGPLEDSLVTGRGLWWHEMVPGSGGLLIPASMGTSPEYLLIDPDAEKLRDAGWIVREVRRSLWRIAEDFGLNREKLRGQYSSHLQQSHADTDHIDRDKYQDSDVGIYYEVYTRGAGLGHKFNATESEMKQFGALDDERLRHCYLAIMPGVPHPLNLDPDNLQTPADFLSALAWPWPAYEDPENPWPCTTLDYLPQTKVPWPTSPLEAALPLQAFLDHTYSYLFGRVRTTCRDLILTCSQLAQPVRDALVSGLDQEVVTVDDEVSRESIERLIHILQFPAVQKDLWQLIPLVQRDFQDMAGVTPLLMGQQGATQMRSSAEAQIRGQHSADRPNDFADVYESCQSRLGAKEAQMSRLYVGPKHVAPLFGEEMQEVGGEGEAMMGPLTQAWQELVMVDDPAKAVAELSYTVEAGSGRRKNIQQASQDAQMLVQTLMPAAVPWAQQGIVQPYNALVNLLAESMETDLTSVMVTPEMFQQAAMMQQAMMQPQQPQAPPQ